MLPVRRALQALCSPKGLDNWLPCASYDMHSYMSHSTFRPRPGVGGAQRGRQSGRISSPHIAALERTTIIRLRGGAVTPCHPHG